jgi:hypothetical protein
MGEESPGAGRKYGRAGSDATRQASTQRNGSSSTSTAVSAQNRLPQSPQLNADRWLCAEQPGRNTGYSQVKRNVESSSLTFRGQSLSASGGLPNPLNATIGGQWEGRFDESAPTSGTEMRSRVGGDLRSRRRFGWAVAKREGCARWEVVGERARGCDVIEKEDKRAEKGTGEWRSGSCPG